MRLMTYKEYREKEHETPYVFKITSAHKGLFYFGERHSFDPNDQQWDAVKALWGEFLAFNSDKKIAFVEGGKRRTLNTEKESIENDGGMGLVTFLASQAGIQTFSPEPDEAYERAELEKEFSRDEIQYYYFARVVHQ